ncbi:carbohydrate-binding protein [Actinoplanes sp. TRM 88003]|uniref:Carbohydrate-binding protein n=1 Tax=Paractinoplanes aksuensis TaxID=2939490 RepID=A0ABT1DQS1_9ACTN|nr:carbohydrate-binding protein [Actinoplanes aksuensis]MCO8273187.1 carbohydrate-binding protein [Actinoplanes aksuensis]
MKRPLTAALAVASTALTLVAAQPATAGGARATVTGTYSAGAADAWKALPSTRVGDGAGRAVDATVVVDPSQQRQRYSGIGMSIDETSVSNLWKLTKAEREKAVRLLVDPKHGAGFDRFRLTIGSPDLIEHLPFWSYDELPPGVSEDFALKHFSIQRDIDLHMVEAVKLIQKYNPDATFFASAWSAPAWMKTNNRFTGEVALKPGSTTEHYQVGRLRDDCIDVFARYYVKYLQAYAKQGVRVDALTLLNEPGMDVVYPAMDISVDQQQKLAVAIKRELRKSKLDTKLYVHDFNFWDWRDPNSTATKNYYRIMNDPATRKAADGIAFHPYWGDPAVMRDAYNEFGKPVHMTETSDLNPATVLNYFRLNASSYTMWAQATDQTGGTLHWTDKRDNNVDWEEIGRTTKWPDRLVKVNTDTKTFSVRDELYPLGQFARYLSPSDVRVESSAAAAGVSNVVYRNGDKFTAVLANGTAADKSVRVKLGSESFVVRVPANAYATYRWKADPPRRDHAPVLRAVPPLTVDQYATTLFRLSATDRDRDRLSFYATDLPAGVSLDATTGVVTLSPTVAGAQKLTFHVTDGAARDTVTVDVNVTPQGAPIGVRVEAESYAAQNGWTEGGANFVESNAGASGGKNIGWTAAGNWLSYRVNVAQPGTYDLELRVANGTGAVAADAITFRDAAGDKLATVSVPATGGWATYQSVHVPVTLAAGDQLVTVFCETGGFNLDYVTLS